MQVRYSYLKQQFANCDDLWNELKKFVSTGDFTLGKHLKRFEKNFANLIGTKWNRCYQIIFESIRNKTRG